MSYSLLLPTVVEMSNDRGLEIGDVLVDSKKRHVVEYRQLLEIVLGSLSDIGGISKGWLPKNQWKRAKKIFSKTMHADISYERAMDILMLIVEQIE